MKPNSDELNELLTCLAEECAEVIQASTKAMRFGIDSRGPTEETSRPNHEYLTQEIGDILAVVGRIVFLEVGVTWKGLADAEAAKDERLKQYLRHATS